MAAIFALFLIALTALSLCVILERDAVELLPVTAFSIICICTFSTA